MVANIAENLDERIILLFIKVLRGSCAQMAATLDIDRGRRRAMLTLAVRFLKEAV